MSEEQQVRLNVHTEKMGTSYGGGACAGILMPSERRMHVNGVARGAGAGHLQL